MSAPDGPHLSFPFELGPDGRTRQVQSLEEHVKQEVIQMLLTNPGERPFLPEFGGGARRLVFEGATEATAAMTNAMISHALERWLSHRVTVEKLETVVRESTITIDLQFRVAGTQDTRRLRFERSAQG